MCSGSAWGTVQRAEPGSAFVLEREEFLIR